VREPVSDQEHDDLQTKKEYPFYVDANRFVTPHKSLTGAQIKAKAAVTPTYQLFLEEDGDRPDKSISDGETVEMKEGEHTRHFYAVPPATFGIR
jgi:hypothetical protein